MSDIVAATLHAHMNELVAVSTLTGWLDTGAIFVPLKALYGTRRTSNLRQSCYSKLLVDRGRDTLRSRPCSVGDGQ